MNPRGRIVLCGMISQYNASAPSGPSNLRLAVRKRLTLQGFIVSDHLDRQSQFYADMAAWMAAGKMHWQETIVDGIENAPRAFIGRSRVTIRARCWSGSKADHATEEGRIMSTSVPTIHAPRGSDKTAKGWIQEAAKRMLMNNLDPAVAEHPADLIVYGGRGKPPGHGKILRRSWQRSTDLRTTRPCWCNPASRWASGTFAQAPRVIIANSNLVGNWANWDEFDRLDKLGLMMYGQMTAGSRIYIGTQGILQGTYETFAAAARKHFNGSLTGTITVTAGLAAWARPSP